MKPVLCWGFVLLCALAPWWRWLFFRSLPGAVRLLLNDAAILTGAILTEDLNDTLQLGTDA
jgi:hypothetical protein